MPSRDTSPPAPGLRGIRKCFDGFTVFHDADFVAHHGEVHALLGDNGAGKSSLMNIAACLKRMNAEIASPAEALGLPIDPRRTVASLSVAEQQRVEILKALIGGGATTLILDKPTAVLTDSEAERLLTTMRCFAASGAAVIMVTHKLGEVTQFADQFQPAQVFPRQRRGAFAFQQ